MRTPKTDYSQISKYYDKVRKANIDAWISRIIEFGGIEKNSHVLDVGCGTGRFPLGISTLARGTIFSIDLSKEMLKKAVEKPEAEKIFWVQADAHRLPFRNRHFDCVYMTLVLHHLEDKAIGLKRCIGSSRKKGNV